MNTIKNYLGVIFDDVGATFVLNMGLILVGLGIFNLVIG